jgi:hypothetical protein
MAKSNGKKEWIRLIQSVIDKANAVRKEQGAKRIYTSPDLLKAMAVALFEKATIPANETDIRSWSLRIGASVVSVDTIVHANHTEKVSIARPDNLVRARLQTFTDSIPSDKKVMKSLNEKERKALALVKALTYCRFVQSGTPAANDENNPDALKVFLIRK